MVAYDLLHFIAHLPINSDGVAVHNVILIDISYTFLWNSFFILLLYPDIFLFSLTESSEWTSSYAWYEASIFLWCVP
jgi:hypothetical protein